MYQVVSCFMSQVSGCYKFHVSCFKFRV
jgi:hypothetical protein